MNYYYYFMSSDKHINICVWLYYRYNNIKNYLIQNTGIARNNYILYFSDSFLVLSFFAILNKMHIEILYPKTHYNGNLKIHITLSVFYSGKEKFYDGLNMSYSFEKILSTFIFFYNITNNHFN